MFILNLNLPNAGHTPNKKFIYPYKVVEMRNKFIARFTRQINAFSSARIWKAKLGRFKCQ